MGQIVAFPDHARASAGSVVGVRATKAVINSEVSPLPLAVLVSKTADHQSAGMLKRCHHLETCAGVQPPPISAAIASRVGQSSIIERNEVGSVMENTIGQSVLNCKANKSYDCELLFGHKLLMARIDSSTEFKRAFIARIKAARKAKGATQAQMAEMLGLERQDHYKQYEGRSLLPHHLVLKFCMICDIDPTYLYTGQGRTPVFKQSKRKAA